MLTVKVELGAASRLNLRDSLRGTKKPRGVEKQQLAGDHTIYLAARDHVNLSTSSQLLDRGS